MRPPALALALPLAGCVGGGQTDPGVLQCAGSYVGTYTGDDAGETAATLDEDGVLTVTFVSAFDVVDADGLVEDDGTITGTVTATNGVIAIAGELDLATCEATGTWNRSASAGSWTLSPE